MALEMARGYTLPPSESGYWDIAACALKDRHGRTGAGSARG
jgi:hypothetical protein